MREVPKSQILERIRFENPWWHQAGDPNPHAGMRPRAYFRLFYPLVTNREPRRAVLLMGPRRIGKTVMLFQAILRLIESGTPANSLFYFDLQSPVYNGRALADLLHMACESSGTDIKDQLFVCFYEIQYLREWEVHLKNLVDSYPNIKFVASGSAAAALRLKSTESGAGRFTDFLLPPVTFYEYLDLVGESDLVVLHEASATARDITALNERFIHYLNFGGYPEVIFSQAIQADPCRYIRNDIIDKVLLKDLPSLYGIEDIQELNSLFATLAYNTAGEVSLEGLSQNSGVAKNTIKRYIEYLQSAFLIKIVHRCDCNARRFKRANFFKVYLTNPSMRSALFAPVTAESNDIGDLVETAVFSQWFHSSTELHYARWPEGEVDIVHLAPHDMKPAWAIEVKWTDAIVRNSKRLRHLLEFCAKHGCEAFATTKTLTTTRKAGKVQVDFDPASIYCYVLGYNIIRSMEHIPFFRRLPRRKIRLATIPKNKPEK